jgi:hypothetical protein
MKIAPVVSENKHRPIWGWSIQAKRTVEYFKTGLGGVPLKNKSKGRKAYSDKIIEAQYPYYSFINSTAKQKKNVAGKQALQ